jgi:adenine deaminase
MNTFNLRARLVNITGGKIESVQITVTNGIIAAIHPVAPDELPPGAGFLLPGFIDSHVHIESSMLVPSEFARLAVVHGTVATVSDPHEIANVCGEAGVHFMIEDGNSVPFKFFFGAPSCVPATIFETAGDVLDAEAVNRLLQRKEIKYLSEMMNFPGVLYKDEEVMKKIRHAVEAGKPVDGHAPGLRGETAKAYIQAGTDKVVISTDHECFTAEEALDKLAHGMKIIIREGSAAKNFEALIPLLQNHEGMMMFCSDDKHPDSLVEGHINLLCTRAVAKGINVFNVLKAACINPVMHYKLDVGLLREGDAADFIVVEDLLHFKVLQTYIDGKLVAENGITLINTPERQKPVNKFNCNKITRDELAVKWNGETEIPVMEALDGQLITNKLMLSPKTENGLMVSDTDNDILKIVVVNRYHPAPVARAFIKNFGFKKGAIASSVAHDSHNIVAVGVDDESLAMAINKIIQTEGGVSVTIPETDEQGMINYFSEILSLPVAGLMSQEDGYAVADAYSKIDGLAKGLGSSLGAPFMTLSFMALLVIPHLKLSDKGLFDGDAFKFV